MLKLVVELVDQVVDVCFKVAKLVEVFQDVTVFFRVLNVDDVETVVFQLVV